MAQNVAEEVEEWKKSLAAEARTTDSMVSINLEKDWMEDLEYNAVDHVEKQETDVVGMKQEIFEDALNGDMVAAIEVIKEDDPEKEISETTCASGDLYKESIGGDVLEAEVSCQSFETSRSTNDSEQILKADGESRDQIEEEADIEVSETNDMIFESFEAAKKSIEEMIR